MLTLPEKVIFILLFLAVIIIVWRESSRIIRTIRRGHGKIDWKIVPKRIFEVIGRVATFQPVFRFRFWPSLFHAFVGWCFIFFLLVNLVEVVHGFVPGFDFLGTSTIGNVYRLLADVLSVMALAGMTALITRRFVIQPDNLTTRKDVLLSPKARSGIRRDSAIVASFIIIHIGSWFMGASVAIAATGSDPWQPFASDVAKIFAGLSQAQLTVLAHIFYWLAIGTILLFIPYFLFSKHLHLFFAPLNFLLRPQRRSIGALDKLDFEDETVEQFGVSHLEDLEWKLIMDAYACIMCYRCQEVCPAYNTGKVLSPAAMEINKRYFLNSEGGRIARGEASQKTLIEFAIPAEAVWACTSCGACVDICPVGNEPMRDILNIRRALVLMENDFPEQLQTAFRGMERSSNPWNIAQTERLKWAEGLHVPTIRQNPEPDILWWVGCAPATDVRDQKIARTFAEILNQAGVNYAVLGEQEQCTGDSARRAGNEFLFNEMALANIELLNEVAPKRMVTTCPHCLHTIKNEYPDFGGHYQIVHHTQFINELIQTGQIKLKDGENQKIAFHDPCYLGRHNGIIADPRHVLAKTTSEFVELPRHSKKSFCCGAGGAQMWKEEQHGTQRVNANRFHEAELLDLDTLAVGCPFCMIMLNDASKDAKSDIHVLDVAEIVLASMERS